MKQKYNISDYVLFSTVKALDIGKHRRWNKEQLQYLKENYGYAEWSDLLENLHPFDKEAIIAKAYMLNIKRECFGWTEDELKLLKENYETAPFDEMKKILPNKTESAIMSKASILGLVIREKWSEQDIKLLIEKYPYYTNKELLTFFPNRTEKSIMSTATKKLNLTKSDELKTRLKEENKNRLLKELKQFAEKLGRTPTSREVSKNKEMDGVLSYHRHFGSYANVCKILGLDINICLFGNEGTIFYSKNKDECLSRSETIITNYLIDNNIPYIKSEELYYKDIVDDERFGRRRFDWLINNTPVEFFGLNDKDYYIERMNYKIDLCNELNIDLIELYPEDLKNNLQGVKEKLKPYISHLQEV